MAKIKKISTNNSTDGQLTNAKRYIADGNYVDAKDEIERVLDASPTDDRALNLLAIVMLKLEQYDKAVKLYEELITRYPQTTTLHTNLGVAYLKNNQAEKAIKEFEFVIKKETGNKTANKLLGRALLKLDKVQDAIESFERAGMHEYANKLKQHGATDSVVSELSGEDIAHEEINKNKIIGEIFSKRTAPVTEQDVLARDVIINDDTPEEEIIKKREEFSEQQIIEENELAEQETEKAIPESLKERTDDADEQTQQEVQGSTLEPHSEKEEEQDSGYEKSHIIAGENTAVEDEITSESSNKTVHKEPLVLVGKGLEAMEKESAIRIYDKHATFISDTLLAFRLNGNIVYVRSKGIDMQTEGLTVEQAYKRYRGKDTKAVFAEKKDDPIILFYGNGMIVYKSQLLSVKVFNIKNEHIFVNDERLEAFYGDLEWENGRLELQADKSKNVTQFKGTGDIFLGLNNGLHSVEITSNNPMILRIEKLLGWYGKLIPRLVANQTQLSGLFISFHGEGVVLLDA